MNADHWIKLVEVAAWPVAMLVLCLLFFQRLSDLLASLIRRIDSGSALETPWGSLGAPSQLKSPATNEKITADHVAIIHSSWRYPKKDREFNKRMYCFYAIIQGNPEVLDRIESVRYILPGWPNPEQVVTDRSSNFKLKELAWGEATLYAKVKIKNQDEVVELNRYINLSETGPRI